MAKNEIGKNWIQKNRNTNNKLLSNTKIILVAPSLYTYNYMNNSFKGIKSKIIPNTAGNFYLLEREALKNLFLDYLKYRAINNNIPTIIAIAIKISEQQNKGADIILDFVHKMNQHKIPFNIITVGEFVQLDIIGTHIHFENRTLEQMKQLYTLADICILPSRYETFSQVTLESIQLGTPVVAFDLTGPKDIIKNGLSGFLVPSFNIDQFITTVIKNLNFKFNNEDKVIELALNTSDEFSPNNIAVKYQELYLEKIID
jgi:glycosyltransferase involved in cell wall biosynthesis